MENGKVVDAKVLDTAGQGHGALAGFLTKAGVEILICGGIGGGARAALMEQGIMLYPGVIGMADQAVEAFLNGSLNFDPNTKCTHHEDGEHDCGSCGSHHGEGHECRHGNCNG